MRLYSRLGRIGGVLLCGALALASAGCNWFVLAPGSSAVVPGEPDSSDAVPSVDAAGDNTGDAAAEGTSPSSTMGEPSASGDDTQPTASADTSGTQPEAVVEGWMNSPGHRANILKESFTHLGVGVYAVGDYYYWVQLFVRL